MSPIDPRELKKTKRTYVDVIETDRLCAKCRYNLKGLPTNGNCPECGRPVRGGGRGFKRFSDNLARAPLFYLKTLAFGAWLLAFSGIALTITFRMAQKTWDLGWAVAAGAVAVLWWTGVFIVTAPRVIGDNTLRDEALDGPHLRTINRLANTAWALAAGAFVVVNRAPVGSPLEGYGQLAAYVFFGIGVVGLVTLGIQLAALADWAGDTHLGERFRITAWIMGAAVLLTLVSMIAARFQGLVTGLIGTLALLVFIVGCIALLFFDWALIQLAGIATWAIHNNITADETDRRVLTARERHDQEMAERTALAIALQDAAPKHAPKHEARVQTAFESNRIAREGDTRPYELEPDPPPSQKP